MFEYFVTKTNKIYLSAVKQRKSHLWYYILFIDPVSVYIYKKKNNQTGAVSDNKLSNKLTWAFFPKRLLHQPFWQGALLQLFYY